MVANDPGQPTLSSDAAALAPDGDDRPRRPGVRSGDRRPPRRHRVRGRRHARQVGRRGMRRPPPRVHRWLEGHVGSRRRHRGARHAAPRRSSARRPGDSPGARAGEVIFLDRVDGELENDAATRTEVVRAIRRLRPDVVLGHDPWKRYRLHPDHRVAGQLVCDAIVGARDPHFHRDLGLDPFRPQALAAVRGRPPEPRRGRHGDRRAQARRPPRPREPVRVDDARQGRRPRIARGVPRPHPRPPRRARRAPGTSPTPRSSP